MVNYNSISTKLLTLCDPVALTVPGREILSNIGGIGFKVGPISPKTGKLAFRQTSVNIILEKILQFIQYQIFMCNMLYSIKVDIAESMSPSPVFIVRLTFVIQ